ncbi:hypothetical protein NI389_12560 [Pseudoalteromonas xiamenensis]|uniref:hypothetical protein n=1 Tax=Pseudoalteromonas xiamenensis TaxID=882626 RepID=UPI0027E5834D|nr:hypothetical protein [Pseudoalteromonas xiamenensis]WMN59042.1 hypothetical protein NI389_12560 [Pseudoalteromonas xiamenensis]
MEVMVNISDDKTYLIGRVKGTMTIEKAHKLAQMYIQQIEETGIKLILNDMRASPHQIDAEQAFIYATREVKNLGLPRDIRSAILVSDGDHSHDFNEIVAQYAGFFVRVFYSCQNALKWLKQA